jgi:2-oxoglutarate dehydrogenase E1 component
MNACMNPTEEIFQCQSAAYIEGLLADFLRDPTAVDPEWRVYFQRITQGQSNGSVSTGPSFSARSLFHPPETSVTRPAGTGAGNGALASKTKGAAHLDAARLDAARLQDRVDQLIRAYRVRGHLAAKIDPLGFSRPRPVELDPGFHR